jgi:hypothetical protein
MDFFAGALAAPLRALTPARQASDMTREATHAALGS